MQPHSKALGVKASTSRFGGGTQPLTGGFAPSRIKCPLWTDFMPHYIGDSYHVQLMGGCLGLASVSGEASYSEGNELVSLKTWHKQ